MKILACNEKCPTKIPGSNEKLPMKILACNEKCPMKIPGSNEKLPMKYPGLQ
jgi:hypothetical protein